MSGLAGMLMGISNDIGNPTQLSEGQKGLFNTLGASLAPMPAVNQEDPVSLRAAATEALRRGDQQTARTYAVMAQQMEANQYNKRQEAEALRQRKAATQESFNESNRMLIGIEAQQKYAKAQEAKQQQQIAGIAKAAMPRIGAENAAILQSLPYEAVGPALKEMLKAPKGEKVSTGIIEQVDEEGNTRNVLVNKDTGAVIKDMGVKKPAISVQDQAKIDAATAGKSEADKARLTSQITKLDGIFSTLDDIEAYADEGGAGLEYDVFKNLPITDSRALENALKPITSNQAFDRLQQMRDESKTGGALGQVSNIELELLKSTVSALDPGSKDFPKQVARIRKHYENTRNSLLGNPVDIDWAWYEQNGKAVELEGKRYIRDEINDSWLEM